MWIADTEDVWKPAEITKDYKEGEPILHLKQEDETVTTATPTWLRGGNPRGGVPNPLMAARL